jgi:MFS transporter, YNFM family, putative membrane transport protein
VSNETADWHGESPHFQCGEDVKTGLFIGHAVASNMVAARALNGRARATALYNISYYVGSSAFGWLGGLAWLSGRWPLVAILVIVLGATACALAGQARLQHRSS